MEIETIVNDLKTLLENISQESDASKNELISIKNKLVQVQTFLLKNSQKYKYIENNLTTLEEETILANQIQTNHNYDNVLMLSQFINDEYSNYYAGLAHFHLNSWKIALNHFNKMENHMPSLGLVAKCHYKLHEFMEAEHACKKYLEIEPSDVESAQIWELLGKIQKRLNRNKEAIESFTKAVELEPFLWTSFKELVELGIEREWPVLSRKNTQNTVKRKQVIPNARKRIKEGELSESSKVEHVQELDIVKLMANGYMLLKNYRIRESIRVFKSLDFDKFENSWILSSMGRACYELNEYHDAEIYFKKARLLDPFIIENMDIYGVVLWHLKKDVELSHLGSELQDIHPLAPETWCVVGNLFSRSLDHEQAIKCFQKAVKINPYYSYGHTLSGHEHLLNDDVDNAATSFREALRINSRSYNAWYGLASVFSKQEKHLLAEYHLKKALEIFPNNPLLHSHLALVIQKNPERLEEALAGFEVSEALSDHPIYKFRKAHVLTLIGRYEEALRDLEDLCGRHVAECNVHYLMGRVYQKLGKKRDAIKSFTLAQDRLLSTKSGTIIKEAIGIFYKILNEENISDCDDFKAEDWKLFE